jgi:hypothetical protein
VTKHMNGKYREMQSRLFLCPTRKKLNEEGSVLFSCINSVRVGGREKMISAGIKIYSFSPWYWGVGASHGNLPHVKNFRNQVTLCWPLNNIA